LYKLVNMIARHFRGSLSLLFPDQTHVTRSHPRADLVRQKGRSPFSFRSSGGGWSSLALLNSFSSMSGVARALGLAEPQGSKIVKGTRKIHAEELTIISEYLDEPVPQVGVTRQSTSRSSNRAGGISGADGPQAPGGASGLLTIREAAGHLGISVKTLRKHVTRGNIPFADLGLGAKRLCVRFTPDDLDEFLRQRRGAEAHTPEPPRTRGRPRRDRTAVSPYSFTRRHRD
jgi:excisionase family DNA binding protein